MFLVIIFSLLFLISILPFSIYICSLRILQFEEANTMSITRCKKDVIFLWSFVRKKVKDHDAILNAVEFGFHHRFNLVRGSVLASSG
jgi:hypothetical protein